MRCESGGESRRAKLCTAIAALIIEMPAHDALHQDGHQEDERYDDERIHTTRISLNHQHKDLGMPVEEC